MDSKNLKKITDLLKYGDGKFLVVEDGQPSFVVMDINQFKKMKQENKYEDFDLEEYRDSFDWDDDRYNIDRIGYRNEIFDEDEEIFGVEDSFRISEEEHNKEDEDEGFSSEDIPFEEFLAARQELAEEKDKKNEIIIEPILNGKQAEESKHEKQEGAKPDLSDIPF